MFELSVPWWELPVRVVVIYSVLLVLVRVSGKRTVGQFTPMDLLVVMLLSEAASSGLAGGEESVTGALLASASLIGINVAISMLTARITWLHTLVEGDPVLIGRDGKIFTDKLRENHVPRMDVECALRQADCDLKDLKFAFLEADGCISVLKKSNGAVRENESNSIQ